MASALDTIAHVVLPNMMKIKGISPILSAMERREALMFQPVWDQSGVAHKPEVVAKEKGDWKFGVLSLPTPKEMGEAYMCAFVAHKKDGQIQRYFTLEYDYVLATKTTKTQIAEREGARTRKIGDGPAITGDFPVDSGAFIDALFLIVAPPLVVDPSRNYR